MAESSKEIRWIEVKLKCDGELAEALAEVLGRFVVNGVVVEQITQFNPYTQENEPTDNFAVSGYLPVDDTLDEKRRKLEEALWHLGQITPIAEPTYSPIRDIDWMTAWKKHYKPLSIGDKFLVMPAWQEPDPTTKRIILRINPAMAFGTGTHPTTQLILRLMTPFLNPGEPVIDVGCGSGILSIAALKMGSSHVLAVDIDSQSVASTQENAKLNDISPENLETGKGSVEEILTGRYSIQKAPLVLANILAPTITRLFNVGLGSLVRERGTLVLSGILDHQETKLCHVAEEAGLKMIDRLTQEDWVSLALTKDI